MVLRLFLFISIIVLVEYYFYQALKNIIDFKHHRLISILEGVWIGVLVLIIISIFLYPPHQWHDFFRIFLSIVAIIEISKIFGSLFMLLDDLRRWFILCFYYIQKLFALKENPFSTGISRSQFLSQLAVYFTFIPFIGFIYGIIKGAYNFKIHSVKLEFEELPKNFHGLKIVQISDLHLGSFFSTQPVEKIVELVLAEKPDIICFTGDLVNNITDEVLPYLSLLKKLKAPLGVYSILGNHDYGDYIHWDSKDEKQKNLQRLIQIQRQCGWDILLNEHRIIEKGNQQIALIGVENWGGNLHFPRYGKLDKAYQGTEHLPFKLLLSHDPSHWDLEVSKKYPDIQLTLSGHTHGFQFGVEYKNIRFSPVQWVYKQWAGLYKKTHLQSFTEKQQFLYVNRGAGFIGYPGRLGIWPEITVIELFHKNNG